jgi:hypothetical protein
MSSAASFPRSFAVADEAALLSDPQSDRRMEKSKRSLTQVCGFDPAKMVQFLRTKFPHDTAKLAGAALNRSPRTVENWLAQRVNPDFVACGDMIDLWGPEFLCAVMTSPPEWANEALARLELEELERRSAALKEKLRSSKKA